MENLLTLLGMLFCLFLVLAATVEVIVEFLRGAVELGGKTTRTKTSLEEALQIVAEFVPPGTDPASRLHALKSKLAAVKLIAKQFGAVHETIIAALGPSYNKPALKSGNDKSALRSGNDEPALESGNDKPALKSGNDEPALTVDTKLAVAVDTQRAEDIDATALELQANAIAVKQYFDRDRDRRIFILRALSAVIGCLLVWQCGFNVLTMVAKHPDLAPALGELKVLQNDYINIVVGGLAAAAGSSYWHDKLDRVRKVKEIAGQLNQPPA